MGERVLVTGASGFLGYELAAALRARGHEVFGTSRDGRGLPPGVQAEALTLDDGGAAAADLVGRLAPRAVFHTAALSAVGDCARDPLRAACVNVEATGALARATSLTGGWLLYTSSDLVFDGTRPAYAESDSPAPVGVYMQTKAEGEARVREADPGFLVARVALLYGRGDGQRRRCFTDDLVARLRAGEPVRLFTDEYRTPLEVADAAGLLADLLGPRPAGNLHVAGPERVSRHEHGLAVAGALGLDPAGCVPIRQADLPQLGPRPADVSLRIDRLRGLLGREPLDVAAGCARLRP